MSYRIRVVEQANGVVYSRSDADVMILFPYGSGGPAIVLGDVLIKVDCPERFGVFDTRAERRLWVRKFWGGDGGSENR